MVLAAEEVAEVTLSMYFIPCEPYLPMTKVSCRLVIVESVMMGSLIVLAVSPLNWLTVDPLKTENICGVVPQLMHTQVTFIFSPNLSIKGGAVESAAGRHPPVLLTRVKLELLPTVRMSPWRYPVHLGALVVYHYGKVTETRLTVSC